MTYAYIKHRGGIIIRGDWRGNHGGDNVVMILFQKSAMSACLSICHHGGEARHISNMAR